MLAAIKTLMNNKLTQPALMNILDWAYDKAVSGGGKLGSASALADDYRRSANTPPEMANALIRWQAAKAGTSGFVSGLGGLLVLPVALPANIASVLFIQLRMIAAIATLGGHDLKSDRVRTLIYMCLVGSAAAELAKDIGVAMSTKLGVQAVRLIPARTLLAVNQKVGFRLVTKFGGQGVIKLSKAVPVLGAVVGGTFDTVTTRAIGNVARDLFLTD